MDLLVKNIYKLKSKTSFKESGVLVVLIILCLLIGIKNPVFFSINNILNVLRQISVLSIVAVGEALIIITGGIDLSVGSSIALGGVVCALLTNVGVNPWVAFIIAIICGALVGAITGQIIVKFKINPFIVTLAMLNIIKGIAYLLTSGIPVRFEGPLTFLGGIVGLVPVPVILMFMVIIIGHVFLTKTELGRQIFAVGGNEKAAKLSGIKVEKVKIFVYTLTGFLGAFAGVITAGNLNTADTAAGAGMELNVIAAVVIGGVSLSGGRGSVIGVIIGAAILGVIKNGFVLLAISSNWQMITIGIVIILACAVDEFRRSRE